MLEITLAENQNLRIIGETSVLSFPISLTHLASGEIRLTFSLAEITSTLLKDFVSLKLADRL